MPEQTEPQKGYPYSIQVLTEALDKAVSEQRNLLAVLAQHHRTHASIRSSATLLEEIAASGAQIVDLNRALWALGERG